VLVLPWNERYTSEHVERLADAVTRGMRAARKAAAVPA